MSFEDSMIEDGFHDEKDYLEHLMDEADKEWERQQHEHLQNQLYIQSLIQHFF